MAEKCVSCEANKQGVTIKKDTIDEMIDYLSTITKSL